MSACGVEGYGPADDGRGNSFDEATDMDVISIDAGSRRLRV